MERLIEQGKQIASGKIKRSTTEEIPNIDPRFHHINKNYNINALSLKCNSGKCKKKPGNKIIVSENKSGKTRELAMLYLCDKHENTLENLEKELNDMTKSGKINISID